MQIKALRETSIFGQQVLRKAVMCIHCCCILILGFAAPLKAEAVGLGNLTNHSLLGEPLNAQIEVINVPTRLDLSQLKVRQIQGHEALTLGVDLVSGWMPVKVKLEQLPNRYQIALSTRRPIKEPLVNVLIELSWPSGTIFREYNVLLNPPGFIPPVKKVAANGAINAQDTPSADSSNHAQDKTTVKISSGSSHYTVKPGDFLEAIASEIARTSPKQVSAHDISQWLVSTNPEAFVEGDSNKLIAGATLTLPEEIAKLTLPKPALAAQPKKPPSGRLRLGNNQAPQENGTDMEARLAANEDLMEMLKKENNDLRNRLDQIENSGYMGVLKSLVEEQRTEINLLHQKLRDRVSESKHSTNNTSDPKTSAAEMAKASTSFNIIPQFMTDLPKGSLVVRLAMGVSLLCAVLAIIGGFAYLRSRSRRAAASSHTTNEVSDKYEFSALWHTEHVSNSTTQKYYEVSEEFPDPETKQLKESPSTSSKLNSADQGQGPQTENEAENAAPIANTQRYSERGNRQEKRKEKTHSNDQPQPNKSTVIEDEIEIDEDLENYLKL